LGAAELLRRPGGVLMAVRAAQPVRRCCGRPATLLPCPARAGVRPVALRPTLSRGLPLSSDGASRAPTWEGSKRCARDGISVVVAAKMGFRGSVGGEGKRAGPTYPAKRCDAASAHSFPWNSGLYATLSMPGRAKVDQSSVQHRWTTPKIRLGAQYSDVRRRKYASSTWSALVLTSSR
jgi:hypothetical protein